MAIGDLPTLGALKDKMRFAQERQRLIAENVANADTPRYRGRDLKPLTFEPTATPTPATPKVAMAATAPGHVAGKPIGGTAFRQDGRRTFEVTPNGNAVNLEEEMTKSAENQMDYQTVTSLYQRGLGLLRMAIGKA